MNDNLNIQADYWNREAAAFERIYSHDKSVFANWLDRYFRRDMYQRFLFTMEKSQPHRERKFLDIGCGSGQYSVEFARRGAAKVLGIDIAENMLDLARASAKAKNVESICEFRRSDVLHLDTTASFDVTIAIGLFDYIADPTPLLERMKSLTTDKVIASFPRRWTWRMPLRKLRLMLRGCPVYFYSTSEIDQLFVSCGYKIFEISNVGKLFCVIAQPK